MKICPDPTLPLKPIGAWEKLSLYYLERGACSNLEMGFSVCILLTALIMWVSTGLTFFGFGALLGFFNFYNGLQSRAICRMIRRAAHGEAKTSTNQNASADIQPVSS